MPRRRIIEQRQPYPNFVEEAGIGACRGDRDNPHRAPINKAYPCHKELAVLDRDAARLAEELIPILRADDERIDAAQHRVDTGEPPDLFFLVDMFERKGDVAGQLDEQL